MPTFDDVFSAAQNLPPSDRIRLIDALRETVLPGQWPTPSEPWMAEAQRRSDAYDAGEMAAAPWADVRERARRRAGLDG